jgi:hypothetical protein
MAVEYITIKGELVPIQLGYEAFKKLQKKHKIQIEDVSSLNWENYEQALFYALEMGHEAEHETDGVKFTYKMTDMPKILNECLWEFIAIMPSFFPDIDEELAKNLAAAGKIKKPPTGQTRKKK